MAAYRRVYDSRLTAKNRDQLRNRTLANRVRARFNVKWNSPVLLELITSLAESFQLWLQCIDAAHVDSTDVCLLLYIKA